MSKHMRWFGKKTGQLFSGTHRVMSRVVGLLKGKKQLTEEELSALRNILIDADVGFALADSAIEHLRHTCAQGVDNDKALIQSLKAFLLALFTPIDALPESKPLAIMVVGVNGVGKTTTIGKLAHYYSQRGETVAVASGDTYRAAAAEQLSHWAGESGVMYITPPNTTDPAAVVFDAFEKSQEQGVSILLADTAGRMHNNQGLMDQLQKVKRVLSKLDADAPHAIWIIIDGSLGQSSVEQAKVFHEVLGVTGAIVTKVDGTAKGGAIFSIAKLGIPVAFVGSGEQISDLVSFDASSFVDEVLEG